MEKIIAVLTAIIGAIVLSIIMAFPTMWMWNLSVTEIFKTPEISLIQALCLNILCSLLFKSNNS